MTKKVALIGLILVVLGMSLVWFKITTGTEPQITRVPVYLREIGPVPVKQSKESPTPQAASASALRIDDLQLTAKAVYISDLESGAVLYKKNEHILRSPASTTKLLTALVALDAFPLDMVVTIGPEELAVEGAKIGFYPDEQLTVESLLKAMLIQSGNDAAYALATAYPGGQLAFIQKMNEVAAHLGLEGSHFVNPAGLDDPAQYVTAYDLTMLAREVMKIPFFKGVVATKETVISDVSGVYSHLLKTTNVLLKEDPSVVGIKTGTTEQAGQVLITQYEGANGTILVVLMGSEDRFSDTSKIVDWIYSTYQWHDAAGIAAL
jgi:serine-type D-Ala-D-Ala carboxypeptidase (penicillin-binding protein 5/6)